MFLFGSVYLVVSLLMNLFIYMCIVLGISCSFSLCVFLLCDSFSLCLFFCSTLLFSWSQLDCYSFLIVYVDMLSFKSMPLPYIPSLQLAHLGARCSSHMAMLAQEFLVPELRVSLQRRVCVRTPALA